MAIWTSPITGTAQSGLTSPTYTIVADRPPDGNGQQIAVSALGGTQSGVSVNSPSNPFFARLSRPARFRYAGVLDANGVLRNVPLNVFQLNVWKGLLPLAGQQPVPGYVKIQIGTVAGADLADPLSQKAMYSFAFGLVNDGSSALGTVFNTGVMPVAV